MRFQFWPESLGRLNALATRSIILLLFCITLAHADNLLINRFGGLNSDDDPLLVQSDRCIDCENVLTDNAFGLGPREGYVQFSTERSKELWVFPVSNGDRYIITLSSNVLKASLGETNFTVIIGTVDLIVPVAATAFGDNFYWASSDGMKFWDTLVTKSTNVTLDFDQLVAHKGRCYGSGVTGDKRTIYISKFLACGDFDLRAEPNEDDPTRLQVSGSLDEIINVLFATYRGLIVWAKASSFGVLHGNKRRTLQSETLSDNVGSAYPRSFQDCDGRLRFLGTKRTVWEFGPDGLVSLTNDKERINELMKTVVQGDATSRSHTETTNSDWNGGVRGLNISTARTLGSVEFSTVAEPGDDWQDNDFTENKLWIVSDECTAQGCEFIVREGFLTWLSTSVRGDIFTQSILSNATWFWSYRSTSASFAGHRIYFMAQEPLKYLPTDLADFNGYSVAVSTSSGVDGQRVSIDIRSNRDGVANACVIISSTFHVNVGGGANQAFLEARDRIKVTRDDLGNFRMFRGLTDISMNDGFSSTWEILQIVHY